MNHHHQKQVNPHGQNRHDKAKHHPRGIAPDTAHSSKKTSGHRRRSSLWALCLVSFSDCKLSAIVRSAVADRSGHSSSRNKRCFLSPVCLEEQKRVFDMKDVEFIRGVDLVWFEDANGHKCVFRDGAFASGKLSIPANTPGNVPCDTSQLI